MVGDFTHADLNDLITPTSAQIPIEAFRMVIVLMMTAIPAVAHSISLNPFSGTATVGTGLQYPFVFIIGHLESLSID